MTALRASAPGLDVPLLNQSPLSHIGTVYISSDATASGEWTRVEFLDTRTKKIKSVVRGCGSGKPYVSIFGDGAKGSITLVIGSCYQALYDALKTLQQSAAHSTAVFYHARGTRSLEVEVLSISVPDDTQWQAGDPVEGVRVQLLSYGTA